MNEIINWIALNNTIMIRIGFTSILILLIVYVFRFLFIPKVNSIDELIVPEDKKSEKNNLSKEEKVDIEKKSSIPDLKVDQSFELGQKTEEIHQLQEESLKLKTQINESEALIFDLKAQLTEALQNASKNTEEASDPEVVKKLNQKNEQLEARLAEYEIIAEEISEISQIRKENIELKQKLGMSSISEETAAVISEVLTEISGAEITGPEKSNKLTSNGADSIIEDFFAMQESPDESDNQDPEQLSEAASIEVLEQALLGAIEEENTVVETNLPPNAESTDELEIIPNEKELIDQFEGVLNKKGS